MRELGASDCKHAFAVTGFATTAELSDDGLGIIGQERAVEAMNFGLRAQAANYHIYVAGPVGTGRSTYVQARLRQEAAGRAVPPDLCYVYDFAMPERPKLLTLPAGEGRKLQKTMERLLAEVSAELRRVFESSEYEAHRSGIAQGFERRSQEITARLEAEARSAGFALQFTPTGIATVPLGPKGEPLTAEAFQLLPDHRQKELMAASEALEGAVSETARLLRELQREARAAASDLDRQTAAYVVGHAVEATKSQFEGLTAVAAYLDAVAADIVEHLDAIRMSLSDGPQVPMPLAVSPDFWIRYRVNVFVDNSQTRGAPVVTEPVANLPSLIGRLEFRAGMGGPTTDFTMLRSGALQQANGGFLVLPLRELLSSPGAYEALKRCLRERVVHMDGPMATAGPYPIAALDPEPVPVSLQVVLIGPPTAYQSLLLLDEDFRKLFKVKVEFDADMPASETNIRKYAGFIATVCRRESTPHLDADAVARVLTVSSRLAEDQSKLSTRFNEIVDLVISSGVWARVDGRDTVGAADVDRARRERQRRAGRVEDRLQEATRRGDFLVATRGTAVGQVNGLTVINLGDTAFGRPVRITARTWAGRHGVVHIERETQMGGAIHTKGVLTVAAYLAATYAQRAPLSLTGSVAFEQTYEEVDGDSASDAELYALLSELAGVPIRQSLAVTGSVDQAGRVQPIGGVNEKIEGFYRTCAGGEDGLTGEQGVVIPPQNVKNLVLDDEVVAAVAAGRFHIWTAATVDEGIEILTGVPAGAPGPDGSYPPESVHGRIAARLAEYAAGLRASRCPEEDDA
jgi:predicted ATP-dependent protease